MTLHDPTAGTDIGLPEAPINRVMQLYDIPHPVSSTSLAGRIFGLARAGIAASDSNMNIDMTKGGYCELFEAIAQVADDLHSMIADQVQESEGA